MSDYSRDNTGTLNRNNKGDNPKRPDWRGSINVDGTEYWVSAWERTAQRGDNAGQKFLSLSIEPKQPKPDMPRTAAEALPPKHGVPDSAFGDELDVPFMALGRYIGRGFHVI